MHIYSLYLGIGSLKREMRRREGEHSGWGGSGDGKAEGQKVETSTVGSKQMKQGWWKRDSSKCLLTGFYPLRA